MSAAFGHVTALLAFVFALALTHLLASATHLVLKRDRVRFSWVQAIWMIDCTLLLLINWLALWDVRNLHHWDSFSIAFQFLVTVLQYFTCSLISPEVPEEGTVDMWEFHLRQKAWYLGAIVLLGILAMADNVYFGWKLGAPIPNLLFDQISILIMMGILVAAIFVQRARYQVVLALLFFGVLVAALAQGPGLS